MIWPVQTCTNYPGSLPEQVEKNWR